MNTIKVHIATVLLALASGIFTAQASVAPFQPYQAQLFATNAAMPNAINTPLTRYPFYRNQEKYNSGYAFYVDNDLLVPGSDDRDYTGGLALTLSGKRAQEYWFSLDTALSVTESLLGLDTFINSSGNSGTGLRQLHSIEFGATAFTPGDVDNSDANQNDRPYASLFYLSNTRHHINHNTKTAVTTTLTVGAIGLSIAGDIYNGIHSTIGSDKGEGWSHQISSGGEPTARFGSSRQQVVASNYSAGSSYEIKTLAQGSVGYLTELSFGVTGRWGRINTPWWTFNPANAKYTEKSSAVTPFKRTNDLFVFAGFSSHVRGYNAFLQGQWKDSDVSYDRNELNTVIHEAWAGVTVGIDAKTNISYFIRGQTSEIKQGDGDRNPIWGGVVFNYSI